MENYYPISVHLILLNNSCILLQKRKDTGYADNLYGLPAGKINPNESATQAMIREAKEELGIHLKVEWLELGSIVHGRDDQREGVAFFFKASKYEGVIENKEPDKCACLKFFDLNSLPSDFIPYMKTGIENTLKGVFFSEFGWKNNKILS